MNLTRAISLFSSLPLIGFLMNKTLALLLGCYESAPNVSDDDKHDAATSSNAAAQQHFRQLQHIRAA
ncbi:Uncharacterized protein TCM_027139 [Theobroma cacao]|uniref:Uncharacterized protein n=1 Tax=Theobroma cacao TaxID=3641 RepID=A0A061GFG6_THECC|nr:Uncharacterized protein TCM_027139 [Theobroma cacao]